MSNGTSAPAKPDGNDPYQVQQLVHVHKTHTFEPDGKGGGTLHPIPGAKDQAPKDPI